MRAARRLFEDDSEEALTVVVARDERAKAGERLSERMERVVVIDVIHQEHSTRPESGPGVVELEAEITRRVHAVMDEEVDLARARPRGQANAACSTP